MAAMAAATVVLTTAKTTMTTTMTTGVNDPFSESSDGAGNGGEGGSSDPSLLQASSSSGPSAAAKAAAGTTDGHEAAVAAPAAAAHPAPPFRTPASAGVVGTTTKTGILRTRLPPPPPAGAVASVVMSPSEMGASEEVVRGYLTHHTPAFEEPSRVARALREMQDEIRRLPTPDREAHDRAVWLMGPQRKQQQQQQRGGGRGGGQSSPSSSVHDVLGRLKLQCLRAELWDGRLAARRLCRHLTLLHEHYGDVALRRELHFADLGKEEARLVRKGGVQLLPTRDRSGRRVVAFVGGWGEGFSVQTHIKVSLYMMSVLAEDLTTQRDGAVCLYYFPSMEFGGGGGDEETLPSSSSSSTRTATSATTTLEMVQHENRRLLDAMPLRFTGVHLCLHSDSKSDEKSPPRQSRVELSALGMLGEKEKMYTRIHAGPVDQVDELLKTEYGVPTKDIPITNTGTIKTLILRQWIKLRQTMDASKHAPAEAGNGEGVTAPPKIVSVDGDTAATVADVVRRDSSHSKSTPTAASAAGAAAPGAGRTLVECPDFSSIVFRKAGVLWDHPPNRLFRGLLAARDAQRGEARTLVAKRRVVTDVMDEARTTLGLRFLSWDREAGGYYELDDVSVIRDHIAQAMRDQSKRKKHLQQLEQLQHQSRKTTAVVCHGTQGRTTAAVVVCHGTPLAQAAGPGGSARPPSQAKKRKLNTPAA